jgi:hypothetical protein
MQKKQTLKRTLYVQATFTSGKRMGKIIGYKSNITQKLEKKMENKYKSMHNKIKKLTNKTQINKTKMHFVYSR